MVDKEFEVIRDLLALALKGLQAIQDHREIRVWWERQAHKEFKGPSDLPAWVVQGPLGFEDKAILGRLGLLDHREWGILDPPGRSVRRAQVDSME